MKTLKAPAPALTGRGYGRTWKGFDMDYSNERWLPVVGFEDYYQISDCGRVWSHRTQKFMALSSKNPHTGHLYIVLTYAPNQTKMCKVHRLVLEAFVGPCPPGMVTCHNNGISSDNRLENLRWDTQQSNNLDLVKHRRHWQTLKTHCPQGHEYTPENTVPAGINGRARRCRTCRDQYLRALRSRQKNA